MPPFDLKPKILAPAPLEDRDERPYAAPTESRFMRIALIADRDRAERDEQQPEREQEHEAKTSGAAFFIALLQS